METEKIKSWKELKAERDAHANNELRRVFRPKQQFQRPGATFQTLDGTKYYIASDGSRRKI